VARALTKQWGGSHGRIVMNNQRNKGQFLEWLRQKRGIDSHGLQLLEAGKFRFREGAVDATDQWIAKLKDDIGAIDRFIAEHADE
jgi:hypothetical protein